jgi:hypothetical protein
MGEESVLETIDRVSEYHCVDPSQVWSLGVFFWGVAFELQYVLEFPQILGRFKEDYTLPRLKSSRMRHCLINKTLLLRLKSKSALCESPKISEPQFTYSNFYHPFHAIRLSCQIVFGYKKLGVQRAQWPITKQKSMPLPSRDVMQAWTLPV